MDAESLSVLYDLLGSAVEHERALRFDGRENDTDWHILMAAQRIAFVFRQRARHPELYSAA